VRISVVLANYNGDKYLAEAMEGALAQDHDDYEVIVVDDGSTDSSRDVIEEFACRHANRLQAVFLAENQGQGEAFNVGVRHASGEIVCFLDSDDLWRPEKLQAVDDMFRRYPDAALVQHNLDLHYEGPDEQPSHPTPAMMIGNVYQWAVKTRRLPMFIPTSGLAFSRHVLQRVLPIPAGFRTCADGYLTRTAMCFGPVLAMHESLGSYRVHSANSVFGNGNHQQHAYINNVLIPELNRFYRRQGFSLRFNASRSAHWRQQAKRRAWAAVYYSLIWGPARLVQRLTPRVYWRVRVAARHSLGL